MKGFFLFCAAAWITLALPFAMRAYVGVVLAVLVSVIVAAFWLGCLLSPTIWRLISKAARPSR